ncbi:uncharacterized protein METZ01_LOCUS249153, partial [marine metagenome]
RKDPNPSASDKVRVQEIIGRLRQSREEMDPKG